MQILRAKIGEAGRLTEIALAAKRHWDYPENWVQSWTATLTITPVFIEQNETYAATKSSEIVGFYALCREAASIRLEHLWVWPACMGQGIGRRLFRHAVERSHTLGYLRLAIESDPNAKGFYERMGARQINTQIGLMDGERRALPLFEYNVPQKVVAP